MKKTIIAVFAVIFVLGIACFMEPNSSVAKAADGSGKNVSGCHYISYTKENAIASFGQQDEIPVATGDYAGWLFGGWFADSELTIPVKTVSEIPENGAYAKFVNPEVLSMKLQVNSDAASANSTNMRLVSSVDSLDYQKVGFKVLYNGQTVDVSSSTVYKRIVASPTSGVNYKYSPKVVGTESEYFVTATLLNIKSDNYGQAFHIEPYWVTFEGVTVYGVNKNVQVNDGLTATTINTTVSANLPKGSTYDVTYGTNGTATATVLSCDGIYANINILLSAGSKTDLNSVTKFTIKNGENDIEVLHRNLMTKYAGTADTSWYEEYDENKTDKYVIATSADLYGMESLANAKGKTFSNKKIYMVADITVNEGTASIENGWQQKSGTTRRDWYAVKGFQGEFDGQNHVISGLYGVYKSATYSSGIGLFTETSDANVRNLSVKNSYYKVNTSVGTGAIIGQGNGTLENIYADICIYDQNTSAKGRIGGLLGVASGDVSITNCWSACDIYTNGQYTGGIVGNANGKKVSVQHCLNSGDVTYTGTGNSVSGGIVGRGEATNTQVTINDCLNVGVVSGVTNNGKMGTIVGTAGASTVTITNTYSIHNYKVDGTTQLPEVGEDKRTDKTGAVSLDYQEVYDMNAFSNTDLSFEGYVADGYWAIRDDNTPMLVSFLDQADETIGTAGRSKTEFVIVDGVGYISTLKQLESFRDQQNAGTLEFAEGDKAVMTSDIEVNANADAAAWAAGTVTKPTAWTAIKNFAGTFDGQGYTISGIYSEQVTGQTGTGLFTQTNGATIQKLKITNSYFKVNTTNGTGAVVGQGSGMFKSIYTEVIMTDTDSSPRGYMGGIIGKASGAVTIEDCWSNSTLESRHERVGGLIGECNGKNIHIAHCLNTGNLTHHYSTNSSFKTTCFFGGLVGRTSSSGTLAIVDSLSTGIVQSKASEEAAKELTINRIAALIGYANNSTITTNTYGIINHDAKGDVLGVTNVTGYGTVAATMHDDTVVLADNTVLGLDYVSTDNTDGHWTIRTNRMSALTVFLDLHNAIDDEEDAKNTFVLKDNKGTISNAGQLASFRDQMNAGTLSVDSSTLITLTNDIVINEGDASEWAEGTNLPVSWVPIYGFSGIFDGGGYSIRGLYSNVNYKVDTTYYGTGLFTNTVNATIQNLQIKNCFLATQSTTGTGAVVGSGTGTLKNIYTEAIIKDSLNKGRMGGIIGKANGTVTVENCWSNCTMESAGTYVGGILGYSNSKNVTISHCLNTGALTYTGTADSYFGGIVGTSCSKDATTDFTASLLQITDCLSVGTVSGTSAQSFMGGVIGNAGGLDGDGNVTVVIENSYSSINLDESNSVVGVSIPVGNNYGTTFTDCESVAYENLLGELAYSSTQLDFVTDSDTTGYWIGRENDTPILKYFFQ